MRGRFATVDDAVDLRRVDLRDHRQALGQILNSRSFQENWIVEVLVHCSNVETSYRLFRPVRRTKQRLVGSYKDFFLLHYCVVQPDDLGDVDLRRREADLKHVLAGEAQ